MKPDPEKIQEIQDTPTPENKKTSQTFLGLTNYMKRFIHVYSTQTYHLRELLKGTKVTYGQKHIGVLLVVKVVFPILKTIKIHFFTQTLVYGISSIHLQKSRNQENCKIVALISKALTSAEKKLFIT